MNFSGMERSKLINIIWIGCLLGVAFGWMIPHWTPDYQSDYRVWYYPQIWHTNPDWILNPLWVYFVLIPLSLLPFSVSFIAFGLLNTAFIALSAHLLNLSWPHRFLLIFSFPVHWLYRLGQLDGFVMLGVALGWWAIEHKRPYLVGLSLSLLLIKPHIGLPIALLYLWWMRDWRSLVVPSLLLLSSQIIWGFDWPIVLIQNTIAKSSTSFVAQETNISLFPHGLLAWLVLLFPIPRMERLVSVICATFLSLPYAPAYSLLVLLVLPIPIWLHAPANMPYFQAYTWHFLGVNGFAIAILAPLLVLAHLIYHNLNHRTAICHLQQNQGGVK